MAADERPGRQVPATSLKAGAALVSENGDLRGANSPNAPTPQLAWQAVASTLTWEAVPFCALLWGSSASLQRDRASQGRRLAGPLNHFLLLDHYLHLLEVHMGVENLRR